MTKQEVIDLVNRFDDAEQFAALSFWVRSDVEIDGEPLTDEQWRRFVRWYEKYQDAAGDYYEAIKFAEKGDN